jgi:hypothetical protein
MENAAELCDGKEDIATGREYANMGNNGTKWSDKYKYYQGFMLEAYVLDMFGYYEEEGRTNPVVALRNDYYALFPKDESPEGILARRTGWSKEAIISGLRAIDYLAYLKSYDPTTRYAFKETTKPNMSIKFDSNEIPSSQLALDEKRKSVFFDRRKKISKITQA